MQGFVAERLQTLAEFPPRQRPAAFINSSPEHEPVPGPLPVPPPFDMGIVPPYMQFIDAGYTDIWTLRPGAAVSTRICRTSAPS